MKAHLQYLWYVLRHKFFVFIWCCKYGIVWAGIIHDLSKFRPDEWQPYVNFFYGGKRPSETAAQVAFNMAWNHHQKRNPHHHQYWVLREDSGRVRCLPMPGRYLLEMVADWRGASKAITGKDDTRNWYLKNRDKMLLHPCTRFQVEALLGIDQSLPYPKEWGEG